MNEPSNYSGLLISSTQISTRPCRFMGFQMNVGNANGTLTIYDSGITTSDSAKVVDKHVLIANNSGISQWNGPNGVICNSGIYATLSGSGTEMVIYWSTL